MSRSSSIHRQTGETDVSVTLSLDGSGIAGITTGIGFFDHMLDLISRHALVDLSIEAKGDLDVDQHHTVEEVGIVLGEAILEALGNRKNIARYGHALVPMDESLASVAIDLSGRPSFVFNVRFTGPLIGSFAVELVEEFFKSVAYSAKMNLHINLNYGTNNHHIAEAIFKAFARALREAVSIDARQVGGK